MSIRRKVLAISSIRSDYNLLSCLYKRIHADGAFDFRMLVSGAHLSPANGYTLDQIVADGLPILAKIEALLSSDTRVARLKSASILLMSCIDQVAAYGPDLIMYAGDREDVLIGGMLGAFLDIPTLHFFGGDHATDGNIDNMVRHATSKLSSLHFVSTEEHAERLLAMGEVSSSIFVVGSPAIDRFRLEPTIGRNKLLQRYGAQQWDRFAVVIFHPVIGDEAHCGNYFINILKTLQRLGLPAFVSYPNIDSGNQLIVSVIEEFKNNPNFIFYHNLPNTDFVNLLRSAEVLVGNSSCGIVEAPFLKLGAVNVGQRQMGRASVENVIFSGTSEEEIAASITQVLSEKFRRQLQRTSSPYGDGYATDRAFQTLKSLDWRAFLRKPTDPLSRGN